MGGRIPTHASAYHDLLVYWIIERSCGIFPVYSNGSDSVLFFSPHSHLQNLFLGQEGKCPLLEIILKYIGFLKVAIMLMTKFDFPIL